MKMEMRGKRKTNNEVDGRRHPRQKKMEEDGTESQTDIDKEEKDSNITLFVAMVKHMNAVKVQGWCEYWSKVLE